MLATVNITLSLLLDRNTTYNIGHSRITKGPIELVNKKSSKQLITFDSRLFSFSYKVWTVSNLG